ncbi:rolling circle replication-associated protein [Coraliomargarita sp. W4R53]
MLRAISLPELSNQPITSASYRELLETELVSKGDFIRDFQCSDISGHWAGELRDDPSTKSFRVIVNGDSLVVVENKCINPTSAKSVYLFEANIKALKYQYPLSQLLFLTITFPPNPDLTDKCFKDKLHRLTTNILNRKGIDWLRVLERNRCGMIHYHLILVLPWDAKDEIRCLRKINTRSCQLVIEKRFSGQLLALSQELGLKLPNYGVGLWNMTPVQCLDAVATYMCKALRSRINQYYKGERRWSCSKLLRCAKGAIAWVGGRARAFRQAVEFFAFGLGIDDYDDFQDEFGPKWFYFNQLILFRFCRQIMEGDMREILEHIRDRVLCDDPYFYKPHPYRKWRPASPLFPRKRGDLCAG